LRRSALLGLCVLLIASLIVPAVGAQEPSPDLDGPCGLTTIDATVEVGPDGTLVCVTPGQEVVVRQELATAQADRAARREALASFFAIADVQLADEESPARGEGADPCGERKDEEGEPDPIYPGVSSSAFRPHETMVPHLMNAHIRAANAIAAAGSPNLGDDFEFLVGLGDLADNQQYNEIRWIIDIIDGGQLIDPDTGDDPVLGGEGYDGPQAEDPRGANGRTQDDDDFNAGLPDSVLELANEPFWATGFRESNDLAAQRLPWYSLPGNHDVKVQGTLPDELTGHHHDDMKAWRAIYRSYYTGHLKVVLQDLPPERKQKLCRAFEEEDQALFIEAMTEILGDPEGSAGHKVVPSDQARMPLYRSEQMKQPGDEEACLAVATPARELASDICTSSWIDEHRDTDGIPIGHGYGREDNADSPRCRDENSELLERACYSFTDGDFHYIALDSNPPEGAEKGNIDPAQFEWLERELIANSSTYFDAEGNPVTNEDGTDRLIVVFAHHPSESMENEAAPSSPGIEEEEFQQLLLRFPNVILNANGHTHQNKIWNRHNEDLGTGYWEVNTSAIADYPTQSRTIEIANNNDGTLSIFATVFDALVPPNAATMDWTADDPTSETALADHDHPHPHGDDAQDINENWLASWGREVMFYDPQQSLSKLGEPGDRNVELLIEAPFDLSEDLVTSLTYTGETSEQVGKTQDAAARLTTESGAPVAGMTLTFERDGEVATSITDGDGVATASLKVKGPPSSDKPITVTFAGANGFLPSSITVPFTAFASPKKGGSIPAV